VATACSSFFLTSVAARFAFCPPSKFSEHSMSYMHPAALAARRKYWTRHDAWRFAAPGTPEAKMRAGSTPRQRAYD
jgi:hypothetical protein